MPRTRQANNKTQPHNGSVRHFLESVDHAGRAADAVLLLELMAAATGEKARLWGASIIGFGKYRYVYESGREGDSMLIGFAPRKANMVIYIMPGFDNYQTFLNALGKHTTGASCLYLGRLSGVDLEVLKRIINASVRDMREKYS